MKNKSRVGSRESRVESREAKGKSRESGVESRDFGSKSQKSKSESYQSRAKSIKSEEKDSRLPTPDSRLIYGVLPVLEALRAGSKRVDKILIADGTHEKRLNEIIQLAKKKHIPFQKIPRVNLARLVEIGANHQGVIAFTASADYFDVESLLDEIFQKAETDEKPLIVILDGVEDPRNLGAILRTVECVGADGVFIPERRAVGLTETVAKTSAGATEYVKTAKVTNISNLIDELKEQNIWTVGTSSDAKMDYTEWDWTNSSALVLGSEGKGLHRLVAEKCDILVKIPLFGKIESLNVSVAAGVILFEAIRQRTAEKKTDRKNQRTKDE